MRHGTNRHPVRLVLALLGLVGIYIATSSGQALPTREASIRGAMVAEGPNDFFDSLKRRKETVFAYSLREAAQLQKYARSYNPATAAYAPSTDAAKFTLLENTNSLATQVWLPINMPERGQTVIIWDWRAGDDWTYENGLRGHKMFQVRIPNAHGGSIWLEAGTTYLPLVPPHSNRVKPLSKSVAGWTMHSRVRVYARVGPNTLRRDGGFDVTDDAGPMHYDSDAVGPVHNNFFSPRATWTRFMFVIEQRPDDEWAHIWYYGAHEQRDPTLILEDVQIGIGDARPLHFDFEINSSQERTGPEVSSYARNVLVMRNVAHPEQLLRRPVR